MKVPATLPIPLDMIVKEWKLLRLEDETVSETCCIDTYWNHFFEKTKQFGDPNYSLVTKVVKAALSLSYGSADIERGFSESGRILTDERAKISERTLNAHLLLKETLYHIYENKTAASTDEILLVVSSTDTPQCSYMPSVQGQVTQPKPQKT
ncbi:unnamed protein product [Timema podura]|uniref:HAT C-terminal dimerisation domain-containing protein n=1 Tax=Timema podura TaxID=61482 RepID=A0ABN7NP78_TIMPD|nr:unnamed protein product [Timema podura]